MSLTDFISDLQNKKVLIFGLGLQGGGVGATRFFTKYAQAVRVTDLKTKQELTKSLTELKESLPHDNQGLSYEDLTFTLGEHKEEDIDWADIILVNQDVFNKAPNSPYIQRALDKHKQIETEIGLFFQLCECPIIGITGTRGKTTTTTVVGELLKNAGFDIIVGGNIPNESVLQQVEKTSDLDYAVLELSNYQLRGLHLKQMSPNIAIITSIYPDHLISYPSPSLQESMKQYINDKKAIYLYQDEDNTLILKQEEKYFSDFAREANSQVEHFNLHTIPDDWHLKLSGIHNRENLGAVYKLGEVLNINTTIIKQTLTQFTGVDHRLQAVRKIKDISFVNDTTATTPVAALTALNSFPAGKIIWLAGGNTKRLPQKEMVEIGAQRVKEVILLDGNATKTLKRELIKQCQDKPHLFTKLNIHGPYKTFKKAILKAYELAKPGDIVLLSPGYTSFGTFKNEFDRGDQFIQIVNSL